MDQPGAPSADWIVAMQPGDPPAGRLSPALLGHYDLSGSLLGYAANPTLIARMQAIGFAEWRALSNPDVFRIVDGRPERVWAQEV